MKTKRKFQPEIIRIKLTPEQAVLTCCAQVGRDYVWGGTEQCHNGGCPVGGMSPTAISS